jgi:hypothetical protein
VSDPWAGRQVPRQIYGQADKCLGRYMGRQTSA